MVEKLDEETECRIADLARSHNVIGLDRRTHARQAEALDALRSRIQLLIKNARKEGQHNPIRDNY